MHFWVAAMSIDTDQLVGLARAAEKIGFTGLALADHVAVPARYHSLHPSGEPSPFEHTTAFPDPLISITAMAAATQRLRFMTYVYVVTMREPFSVAKQVGGVATLSGNRFALGVGAGWLHEEIALLGQNPKTRGRRMDEMLDVIRAFLEHGTTEFHGEFFDFGPTGIFPVPEQRVPIWVGGKSIPALRRAARHDGWLGMNYPMDEIRRLLPALGEARAKHADATGVENENFETLVIPQHEPDPRIYAELEASGVTSTVCTPWPLGDPAYASLDAKSDAMEKFARRFLESRQPA